MNFFVRLNVNVSTNQGELTVMARCSCCRMGLSSWSNIKKKKIQKHLFQGKINLADVSLLGRLRNSVKTNAGPREAGGIDRRRRGENSRICITLPAGNERERGEHLPANC